MKREEWHDQFLASLAEMSDAHAQTRAWALGEASSFPSPTELVCQVFDDSGVGDLLELGSVFSPAADAALRELGSLIRNVEPALPADALASDPRWAEVTRQAAIALDLVNEALLP